MLHRQQMILQIWVCGRDSKSMTVLPSPPNRLGQWNWYSENHPAGKGSASWYGSNWGKGCTQQWSYYCHIIMLFMQVKLLSWLSQSYRMGIDWLVDLPFFVFLFMHTATVQVCLHGNQALCWVPTSTDEGVIARVSVLHATLAAWVVWYSECSVKCYFYHGANWTSQFTWSYNCLQSHTT